MDKTMKKIYLGTIISFLILGFFGGVKLAEAGCCVDTCTQTTETTCADDSTPDIRDCSEIESCSGVSTNPDGSTTIAFVNPLGFDSVSELLSSVLSNLMGIIAFIAVIFIIIGGIMYMTSGGNEAMVTRAKKTWTGAVIGLAIALSAPTFLKEIKSILGGDGASGNAENWVNNSLTIKDIIINVLNLLLSIFGFLATIALIVGGIMYLTAYGSEKRIDDGKRIFKYAIIGIVISLSALIVVKQIGTLFGATMN